MKLREQTIWMGLLAMALAIQACGDDTEPQDDADAGDTDGGNGDGGGSDSDAETDGSAPVCEGGETACSRDRDCLEAGLTGFTCEAGCCVEDNTLPPCTRPGATCESDDQTTDSFVCDTGVGVCLARCADATTDETQGTNCPPNTNSFCFQTNEVDPPVNEVTGDLLDGICIPGDCTTGFNEAGEPDPSVCDGVTSIFGENPVCAGGACTCLPFGNGASYCAAGGSKQLGETCGSTDTDLCEGGLACELGLCVEPCLLGAEGTCADGGPLCPEGETCTCLDVTDTSGTNRPGVCSVECDPFSANSCTEGSQCTPIWGRFGLNGWICRPTDSDSPIAIGEACNPTEGVFGTCVEGALCLSEDADVPDVGTCSSICDPLGVSRGENAGCAAAAGGPTVVPTQTYFGDSDYVTAAADEYAYEVRTSDGTFIRAVEVDLAAGEVVTVAATVNDAGALTLLELPDFDDDNALPDSGIRGVHAASGVGPVDVYLSTVFSGLTYGSPVSAGIATGTYDVDVIVNPTTSLSPAGNPLTLASEEYVVVASLVGTTPTISIVQTDAPSADAEAVVRLFHGANGGPNVDILVECGAAASGGCVDPGVVASDLAYGDLSTLEGWLELDADAYSVSIYVAGDLADAEGSGADPAVPLLTAPLVLADGDFVTAVAFLDGTDLELGVLGADPTPAAGQATLTVVHAISTVGPVDAALESTTPVREDLAFGGTLGSEDSNYVGLPAGSYILNIRAADAAASAAALLTSGTFELEEGAFWTAFAVGSGTGTGASAPQLVLVADIFPTLAEGEGAFRFVHAAFNAPGVQITEPGEATEACAPIAIDGLGLCQELCEPFPRRAGEAYPGCENETDVCFPYVQRDDRAVTPLGSCQTPEAADTGALGDTCPEPGFIGGGCADLAVCIAETEEDTTGECVSICENFVDNADNCPEGQSCSGVQPLVGNLAFSICFEAANPGSAGDRCDVAGGTCAEDGTLCVGISQTENECVKVCRAGFAGDCADGQRCATGLFGPTLPTFTGICQ
jgi:hypothetical protein